jgi:hypothetical protein
MANETTARPRALVTGASSGIGAAFSERLARDQYDLVVVGRRRERLESLAQRLRESQRIAVDVIVADLTQPGELRVVESRVADDTALELLWSTTRVSAATCRSSRSTPTVRRR